MWGLKGLGIRVCFVQATADEAVERPVHNDGSDAVQSWNGNHQWMYAGDFLSGNARASHPPASLGLVKKSFNLQLQAISPDRYCLGISTMVGHRPSTLLRAVKINFWQCLSDEDRLVLNERVCIAAGDEHVVYSSDIAYSKMYFWSSAPISQSQSLLTRFSGLG
ncbi:hypothetical protein I7I51_00006 [Histoplasma capsulatum]|uniref:Uncharacterized protein n=1 Tax=Ajellomyces capsulatus TaxID=5037 RepID=A0A8A1MAE8_AJECA|nr:hypothetical protein I7I51_00006 [Histoplasma capsulatum]